MRSTHTHGGRGVIAFEDLHVGRSFPLGPITVTADEIVAFAAEFDPQDFHTDGESAQASR